MGKTRLAEETADYAATLGFRVIWGRRSDSGGEPPFWPWIQLVREGLRISSVAIPERLRRLAFMAPERGSALETVSHKDALPVHRVSGGNPFFLLEIASSLAAQPAIVQRSFDTAAVPDSIRAAVQRRTSAFRERTREILDVCALLGQEFDLPLLSEVCGLPSEEIVDALDEAINNLFIAEVGNGAGRYSFVHAITAEALRSELDTNTRFRLHQRIGAAIEAVYCEDIDNHLAELAHHHVSSLPLGSIDEAVEFSTRALARRTIGWPLPKRRD
jgi:hypothetical protein